MVCSSVTNDWKSQQWVIVGLREQLTIIKNAIFRDGTFGYWWALRVVEEWIYEMNSSAPDVVCVKSYAINLSKFVS